MKTQNLPGIYLSDILQVLWRRKWLISAFAAVATLAGVFLALKSKPKYIAISKFVCQGSGNSKIGDLSALASLAGIKSGSGSGPNPAEYLNEILEDDDFLERLIRRRWSYRGDSATLMEIWQLRPDTAREDWQYVFLKSSIQNLKGRKSIKLEKEGGNGVFTLETKFEDPKLAFQVNSFILQGLGDYLSNSVLSKARDKRHFIEKRVSEVEVELRKDENALVAFKLKNRDVTAPNVYLEMARLERAIRMDQEIYLQLKKEYEIAKIDERNDAPLMEVLSKPAVPISEAPSKSKYLVPAGLVLGLIAGCLAALAQEWRGKGFA